MLVSNAETVASVLRSSDDSGAFSPLAALGATRTLSLVIEDTMRALVVQARSAGATWQDVGDVLGTTRQAAFQRFGSPRAQKEEFVDAGIEHPDAKAVEVFTKYTSEDWSLRDEFDSNMSERLSEDLLASGWAHVTQQLGAFERMGNPEVQTVQGHAVVDLPLFFERAEMKGRVAFDGEGKIAGLFILNPSVA